MRLRHVAAINPPTPQFEALPDDAEVPFLPLEAVWPDGRLDTTQRRKKVDVATGYTRLLDGDVVVPKITPTFQADRTVIATPIVGGVAAGTTELHVVRVGAAVERRYVRYLFSTRPFLSLGEASMIGVAGQKRVPDDCLRDLEVPVSDSAEQREIADFLDAETARIDALIAKKRRMIDLLDKRWLATLETAVAGSSANMTALKRVAVLTAGGTPDTDDPTAWGAEGTPWVAIGDMSSTRLVLATNKAVSTRGLMGARLSIGQPGTVLFAMYASVGAVSRLGVEACWNQAILGIRGVPGRALDDFIELWLERLRPRLSELFRSNAQDNLNAAQVGALPFPLWSLEQQGKAAKRLGGARGQRDHLTMKLNRQIELLQERRQALITAAVTGQLAVAT